MNNLQELEDLLIKRTETPSGGFEDLEALLAESLEAKNKEIRVKQAKAAQAKGFTGFSKEEAELCNRIVEQWELEHNWTPVQDIAVFHHYQCNCGNVQEIFSNFLQRQNHKRTSAVRWVTVDEDGLSEDLPRQVAIKSINTSICSFCSSEYDFNIAEALPLEEILHGETVV